MAQRLQKHLMQIGVPLLTDYSGLLLVVMTLVRWPKAHVLRAVRRQLIQDMKRSKGSPQLEETRVFMRVETMEIIGTISHLCEEP